MKKFFQEYGSVALGILALLVLIAMITPVGNIIKTSLQGQTTKLSTSLDSQIDISTEAMKEAQNAATLSVDMHNINKSGVIGDFSSKGNLVTINGKRFRVLSVDGSKAKVVSQFSYKATAYSTSVEVTSFNGTQGKKYEGSTLDNEMTNYYNALPKEIQDAIVETNIKQTMYKHTGGTNENSVFSGFSSSGFAETTSSGSNYYLTKIGEAEVGSRKVYALDVEDLIEYFGNSVTPQELNECFFGVRNSVSNAIWLRSARDGNVAHGYIIYGPDASIDNFSASYSYQAYPAFIIDLNSQ